PTSIAAGSGSVGGGAGGFGERGGLGFDGIEVATFLCYYLHQYTDRSTVGHCNGARGAPAEAKSACKINVCCLVTVCKLAPLPTVFSARSFRRGAARTLRPFRPRWRCGVARLRRGARSGAD